VDEAYIGGKEKNKQASKCRGIRCPSGKQVVLGRQKRRGRSVAKPIERTDKAILHAEIEQQVVIDSEVHTDELRGNRGLKGY